MKQLSKTAILTSQSYGKEEINLLVKSGIGDLEKIRYIKIDLYLEGDFSLSYLYGDNSTTLPTDTMKIHAHTLANEIGIDEPQYYSQQLLRNLLDSVPKANSATVKLSLQNWESVNKDVIETAILSTPCQWITTKMQRSGTFELSEGFNENILRKSFSSFTGFLVDELTQQSQITDRVLSGNLKANWNYKRTFCNYQDAYKTIRLLLLKAFSEVKSNSVQQNLFSMAAIVLSEIEEVDEICLEFIANSYEETTKNKNIKLSTSDNYIKVLSITKGSPGVTKACVSHA